MARSTSRISPVRAAIRIARRDVRRNLGRNALIAVMIGLPVLAASTVSVLYRSDERDPQQVAQAALGHQAQALITYQAGQRITQGPDGQSYGSTGDPSIPLLKTEEEIRSALLARLPGRDRLIAELNTYAPGAVRLDGRRLSSEIREIDYTATGLGGLFEQLSGRAPAAPGEVVISRTLANRGDVQVGDTLSFALKRLDPPKSLQVVGVVGGANLVGTQTIIGPPGTLIPIDLVDFRPSSFGSQAGISWRVTGPDPVTWEQIRELNAIGAAVTSRAVLLNPPRVDRASLTDELGSASNRSSVGIGIVVIGLVLLQIALLAGPAIAVGARRNQRGLAIMASVGAERRQLRAVLLASGGVIGMVSGLAAAALGAGLGAVIVTVMIRRDNDHLLGIDVQFLDLLGLAAVGGLTAVAAALIPAWQAARLDVVAVLTGRRGRLPSRLRVPIVGLIVTATGVLLAYLLSGRHRPFPTVAALALAEIGLIMATGAVVSLAARAAGRLPFATRFALRDAARQRSRTVPAVAAVLAAVAGATCALVYVASQAVQDERSYTVQGPLGSALVTTDDTATAADLPELEATLRRTLPVAGLAPYRTINPGNPDLYVWLEALVPPQQQCPDQPISLSDEARSRAYRTDPRCSSPFDGMSFTGILDAFDDGSGYPVLAGQSAAAALPAVQALRAGRVVIRDPRQLWPDGTVHIKVGNQSSNDPDNTEPDEHTVVLPATVVTAPDHLMLPIYPLTAAKPFGVDVQVRGLMVDTERMPTKAEEETVATALEDLGGYSVTVERGYQDNFGLGLLALVIAALVVGLGGTFTAVGLAAAETRPDVATLAAVGASPGVRRRLAANQAGVIAGLGTSLGLLSGLLAGWALIRMKQPTSGSFSFYGGSDGWGESWRLVLPWSHLLAIGIGIPLLAIAVGYLSTRSRLPLIRRIGQ